ncbi:unnamed protein product [Cylicocyclus nassatus]|uniref:Uncharacterized protein n=1 Tax=Cylicocyclus nassatus TaxID=53992 RepID=A0AA36GFZ6_CYLNA|nr:unnamed protein product [Cylicocyclus nassatus]
MRSGGRGLQPCPFRSWHRGGLERTLQEEYETALKHEGAVEEYQARLKAREDIIVFLRKRDGRALLTLDMVGNTISGLMERNDGTPYNWQEVDDDNAWRGDRPGMKLHLGHVTIINLGGFMYIPSRMTALLKRNLENIRGIYFVNLPGLDPIIRALKAANRPYRNL